MGLGGETIPSHTTHTHTFRSSQTETQGKKFEERVPHPTLEPS